MSAAILIDKVSKQYRIGHANPTLRETLTNLMTLEFLRKKKEDEIIWALRDVSFSIQKGETVGIIGRNGAGKSTLLKILSKITHPTFGSTKVRGRVASLLEVGTGFHEELTGRENVYLNGSILGMSKRDVKKQLDAIVEFSGVEQFIDTPIKRYSSGMRLRLGFAVAAHLEPDILIIDEVLAVGDASFQKKCMDVIQNLRAAAHTILFVSHNLTAVENLCERCVWIDRGVVQMDGESRTVLRDYMASLRGPEAEVPALEDVGNRRGNGKMRFKGVEYLSPDGVTQKIVRAGDPLVIRFHYCAYEHIPYSSLGFRMYTETGTLVTDTSTSHHGIFIPSLVPGEGYLDLEIPCLNLVPAKYMLSLWASDMAGGLIYDNIEQAVPLEVETADFYNSGRPVDSRFGIVFFPQKWNLKGMPYLDQPAPSDSTSSSETLAR
jgi:lipopolysaccharide transport system ATP-binding protein